MWLSKIILIVIVSFHADAVVGLERTVYSVPEAGMVVEICAIVYQPSGILCPIDTPFDVQLSTFDGSAGKSHIAAIL